MQIAGPTIISERIKNVFIMYCGISYYILFRIFGISSICVFFFLSDRRKWYTHPTYVMNWYHNDLLSSFFILRTYAKMCVWFWKYSTFNIQHSLLDGWRPAPLANITIKSNRSLEVSLLSYARIGSQMRKVYGFCMKCKVFFFLHAYLISGSCCMRVWI